MAAALDATRTAQTVDEASASSAETTKVAAELATTAGAVSMAAAERTKIAQLRPLTRAANRRAEEATRQAEASRTKVADTESLEVTVVGAAATDPTADVVTARQAADTRAIATSPPRSPRAAGTASPLSNTAPRMATRPESETRAGVAPHVPVAVVPSNRGPRRQTQEPVQDGARRAAELREGPARVKK
ncbi:hypothetical protein PHYPSEUDO_006663 [Phytophthora pseudosyringae]|uniref:Uncharacterized protein n=1 Tax=Phytophthora pseudosyringae TaxID=221518 RepID=A0A8T1WC68_9STRA|nr:hypothetical protein PHYPSEUDO_006663 [Phytophthora pseudosyringae]